MPSKRKMWVILTLVLVLSPLAFVPKVDGAEVNKVETQGNIGFTGTYVPIGTPDPPPERPTELPPVTEITKPGGSLPQTNGVRNTWLIWLGFILLSYVFIRWKQKQRQNKKLKQ